MIYYKILASLWEVSQLIPGKRFWRELNHAELYVEKVIEINCHESDRKSLHKKGLTGINFKNGKVKYMVDSAMRICCVIIWISGKILNVVQNLGTLQLSFVSSV